MISPASRTEILDVIADAEREANHLFERTNEAGRAGRDLTPLATVIAMFGERARRGLRALRLLADHAMDDQAASVARAIVDAAIMVEYLRRPTIRAIGNRQVQLSVEDKLSLFWSFKVIAEQHSKQSEDKKRPELDGYRQAVQLRVSMGLLKKGKRPSAYWSGVKPWEMYRELKATYEAQGKPEALDSFQRVFGDLSFYAHPNPNDGSYFIVERQLDGGASLLLRGDHENSAVYGAAATAALLTLGRWSEVIGEDPTSSIVPLALRLRRESM
jgi:hypothetical protein